MIHAESKENDEWMNIKLMNVKYTLKVAKQENNRAALYRDSDAKQPFFIRSYEMSPRRTDLRSDNEK